MKELDPTPTPRAGPYTVQAELLSIIQTLWASKEDDRLSGESVWHSPCGGLWGLLAHQVPSLTADTVGALLSRNWGLNGQP